MLFGCSANHTVLLTDDVKPVQALAATVESAFGHTSKTELLCLRDTVNEGQSHVPELPGAELARKFAAALCVPEGVAAAGGS